MVSVKTKPVNCGERLSSPKNYNGIDLVKFICSILVFMIHVNPFSKALFSNYAILNYGFQQGICRIAVPFFFVSSGFFLFKKMDLSDLKTDVIKKYCLRIMQLLGIWSVLLFMGGTLHLWYMGATGVAVVLLTICLKKLKMRLRYVSLLAVILYILGLIGGTYNVIIEPLRKIAFFRYPIQLYEMFFGTTRNGVFFGVIFVLMGALFAHGKNKLAPWKALTGFAVSLMLMLTEAFLVRRYIGNIGNDMYLMLLPAAFFMFSFAINVRLKDRPIYRKLRTVGVLVYFTHLLVKEITYLPKAVVRKLTGFDISPYDFFLTLILTLALSFFIEWLSRKEKFKWINWLL